MEAIGACVRRGRYFLRESLVMPGASDAMSADPPKRPVLNTGSYLVGNRDACEFEPPPIACKYRGVPSQPASKWTENTIKTQSVFHEPLRDPIPRSSVLTYDL